MHIKTVRFERVFDVQSGTFSFEADGKRQFGVVFDHKIVPDMGATFAVALDEPGNWQTVAGWRDLSTVTVWLKRSAWDVAIGLLFDFCFVLIPIPVLALVLGGPWAALAAFGLMVLGACAIVVGTARHNRQIERALLAAHPPPPRAVTGPDMLARRADPTAPAH